MPASEINPVRAMHGSGCRIERWDYAFTNKGADQLGSGWYFTDQLQDAAVHMLPNNSTGEKIGGSTEPTVHVVNLYFRNPLPHDLEAPISSSQVKRILLASSQLHEALADWGDVDFEGHQVVLARAIDAYANREGELLRTLNQLSTDFFRTDVKGFNTVVRDVLGYDGVIREWADGPTHYVAWHEEQIEILERLDPDQVLRRLAEQSSVDVIMSM